MFRPFFFSLILLVNVGWNDIHNNAKICIISKRHIITISLLIICFKFFWSKFHSFFLILLITHCFIYYIFSLGWLTNQTNKKMKNCTGYTQFNVDEVVNFTGGNSCNHLHYENIKIIYWTDFSICALFIGYHLLNRFLFCMK